MSDLNKTKKIVWIKKLIKKIKCLEQNFSIQGENYWNVESAQIPGDNLIVFITTSF